MTGTIKYKSEFKPPYLPGLKKFKGTISIGTYQNKVTIIDGFSSLEHINGRIFITGFDTSITIMAFANLKTATEINMQGIGIYNSFHFIDAGFNNLEYIDDLLLMSYIGKGLFFGFNQLKHVRRMFHIYNCHINGFNGFKKLKVVGRALGRPGENRSSHFNISFCPFLEDLTAFDNLTITPSHSGDYIVRDNPKISACNIPALCYLLANLKGDILFINNAPGCNSVEEVLLSCTVGTDENTKRSWIVYPNPATDILYIRHEDVVHDEGFVITDLLGKFW